MTILRHLKLFPTGVVRPTLALGFAVMAVAIMACSFDFGIARVGISADGSLFVEAGTPQLERYHSDDGGLTWRPAPTAGSSRRELVAWGDSAVNTPRGRYSIEGSEIIRAHGGEAETAYSAAYLRDAANRILQSRATSVVLTTTPQGIAFDRDGGSVVIAMGSQGVVVGGSDGRWRRIAVGHYTPTDFSVSARMGLLGSLPAFWAMLLLFVGSVPAVAVVAAQCRLREGIAVIAVIAAAALAIRIQYQQAFPDVLVNAAVLLTAAAIAVIAGPVTAFLLKRWPAHAAKRRILALSTVSAPLVWVALTFPRLGPWADGLGAVLFSFLHSWQSYWHSWPPDHIVGEGSNGRQ